MQKLAAKSSGFAWFLLLQDKKNIKVSY